MTVSNSTSAKILVQFNKLSAPEGGAKSAFLNVETGEVVFTLTKEASDSKVTSSAEIYALNDKSPFIIVNTEDKTEEKTQYKTAVYSYLGKEIAVSTSDKGYIAAPAQYGADLWLFDGKVYLYRDGEATYLLDKGLAKIPSVDYVSDKYFYEIEDSGAYVYDRELKLVTGYEAPTNSIRSSFFVLSDGNILAQNIIYLPNETEEYDLFLSGYKCNIEALVIEARSGKTESIDLDFYVLELSNAITNPDLKNESIKYDVLANVARVSRVENHTLSTNEELVNLSDDFVLINYLAHEVPMQEDVASPVGNDRYIVKDKSGKEYLVDGSGELIGEVTDATYSSQTSLFLYDEKYYDKDLNLVLDLNDMDYELWLECYPAGLSYLDPVYSVYRSQAEGKEHSYYVFRNGKMCQINVDTEEIRFYCDYNGADYFYYDYATEDQKLYRAFCDFNGNEIFKVEVSAQGYVSVKISALGEGNCLLLEHMYNNEDGTAKKDFYISICK